MIPQGETTLLYSVLRMLEHRLMYPKCRRFVSLFYCKYTRASLTKYIMREILHTVTDRI